MTPAEKAEYQRKWRENNPDYHRLYEMKRYREQRDTLLARQKKRYAAASPEQVVARKAARKAYREANKDHLNAKGLEYKKAYLEKDPDYRKKVYASLKRDGLILRRIKDRAKKTGRKFDLTRQWVLDQGDHCAITGIKFVDRAGTGAHPMSASVDRIDNARGYTTDNCRLILWAVNRFKNKDTDEVMFEIARAIVANSPQQQRLS